MVPTLPGPTPTAGQLPEFDGLCPCQRRPEVTQANFGDLLGTLAHELRTPFAAILSGVNVITADCDIDLPARRVLTGMERQVRQAMRLVDDLFDVCASSWGKLSLRKEVVNLAEVVAGATGTTAHLFAARRHRLAVMIPPGLTLTADPSRLEQVLTNLLSNAAKFTDPGGHVLLSAEVDAGQVVLRVRDNGRGIAREALPSLFTPFYQTPGAVPHGMGGLGIGLALVKSLVELHGGSVTASSDGPGTGSEFVVRLPARAPISC